NRGDQRATLQWRPSGGAWRAVDRISTAGPTGALEVGVKLPGTGSVRLAWSPADARGAATVYSRAVAVRRSR
ncbi:MAG: hypothetical protein ACRDRD_21620, partial [Pseudonocardiaceae bacterium]